MRAVFHTLNIMKQYSKRTAILHWLIFVLIIAAYFVGHELGESKDAVEKPLMYPHFIIGNAVLFLALLRIFFNSADGEPAPANANPRLNRIAAATHALLNVSVIALALTGTVTLIAPNLVESLQAVDPGLFPSFRKDDIKQFHEFFLNVTFLLVAFHIAAALYHQFVLRDNLLRRIMIKRFPD